MRYQCKSTRKVVLDQELIHLSTLSRAKDRQRSFYLTQPEVSEPPAVLNGTQNSVVIDKLIDEHNEELNTAMATMDKTNALRR
jgi:hypothetical protein